jgi:hypothetical protein
MCDVPLTSNPALGRRLQAKMDALLQEEAKEDTLVANMDWATWCVRRRFVDFVGPCFKARSMLWKAMVKGGYN